MDDRRIEHLARRLGDAEAQRVDADQVAERVMARLHAAAPRAWWSGVRTLRAAAAALVVVGSGVVTYGVLQRGSVADPPIAAPVELAELRPTELAEILDSLELEAPVAEFVSAGLDDLTETELQQLLATMEGD